VRIETHTWPSNRYSEVQIASGRYDTFQFCDGLAGSSGIERITIAAESHVLGDMQAGE
jgi:hypothetical protein